MMPENAKSSLIWSPTYSYLQEALECNHKLLVAISPFITLDGLKYIVDNVNDTSDLQIVARWHGQDLLSGASDIGIYPFLKDAGIPLFIHPTIHLKLLIFDRAQAFHSSGNITRNGLGLNTPGNIEVGCDVTLLTEDWNHLYRILAESERVDDHLYQQAKEYIESNKSKIDKAPKLTLKKNRDKEFSWLSLPATNSPEELWQYYIGSLTNDEALELAAAANNDLVSFSLPDGLDEISFHAKLKRTFQAHPFIKKFVEILTLEGSLRFGFVRAWLQENCSDKPRPYRKDLNSAVSNLYNWLQYYFDEVTWDRPRHSMVIYWKGD